MVKDILKDNADQVEILSKCNIKTFEQQLADDGMHPLCAQGVDIFQMNLGKICNQVCKHCHVNASPDRNEYMDKEIMLECLRALDASELKIVDLTGGAPEMNPHFKWLIYQLLEREIHIMVRCNLTILTEKDYIEFPVFYKENNIEIISSLPYFIKSNTDKLRGEGIFEKSIDAIKKLNQLGYGKTDTHLILNLVYNPAGAFLPPNQNAIEQDFKRELYKRHQIVFNNLYTITNMPISRFLDYLIHSNNFEPYMQKLYNAYNPIAAENVMCRTTLSVGWDGHLYDCDFNQMLNLRVDHGAPIHIRNFQFEKLSRRQIVTGKHCYGCTAGAGSSCGGQVV